MSYCINPNCSQPENAQKVLFCQTCGSNLLLQGCYRINKPLGTGGFGNTYEIDECGELKILKVLHNTVPKAVSLFQQEAQVLSQLHHPGIPKVDMDGYFTYTPRNSQTPLHCLVMQKIEGMNLEEYMVQCNLEPISKRAAINWLRQLVEILQQVHAQSYFHRDIKPPNIMLKPDGNLALIDFGTAREVTQTYMQKLAGQQVTGIFSPGYTPSEQMHGRAVPQSDFYALGRTFVYLLTGKAPTDFPEDRDTGTLLWHEAAPQATQPLIDLLDEMMSPFWGKRPDNAEAILQKLTDIGTSFPPPPPEEEEEGEKTKTVELEGKSSSISKPVGWKFWGLWVLATVVGSIIFRIVGNALR